MNPIILITGTGKGIGKSLAELFLKKGFNVFGYSRKNKIKHENFTFIKINLNDLKLVQNLRFPKTETEKEIILINNAATIGHIAPLNKKIDNDIINEYNLNIITPSLLSYSLLKQYPKNKKLRERNNLLLLQIKNSVNIPTIDKIILYIICNVG